MPGRSRRAVPRRLRHMMTGVFAMPKRIVSLFLCVFLLLGFAVTAQAITFSPSFEVESEGVYMINLDTDTVVYEKNADQRMYPASLTKIMTAILAIENTPDLQVEVTYPLYVQDIVYNINYNEYGGALSLAGLLGGEVLTMENLLYGALLPSGNEAAMIIADYVGDGSIDYFVEMMNDKAQELGMENTHFANPAGLFDEENYTTPYDLAILARYAIQNETFREIVGTSYHNGGPTNLHETLHWNNTNWLLDPASSYYYAPVKGIKTGTLDQAGRCFVSYAEQDGFQYLLVVMGGPINDSQGEALDYNSAFTDTIALYQWAFETLRIKTIVDEGELLDEVPLRLASNTDHLKLMSGASYTALMPDNVDSTSFQMLPELPESVDAPVEEGQSIGELRLMLAGEEVGRIPLVSAETVERSEFLYTLDIINRFFESFLFKFLFIFFLLLCLAYLALMFTRNYNRQKYRRVRRRKNL